MVQVRCSQCLQFKFQKSVYSGTQHLLSQSIKIYCILINSILYKPIYLYKGHISFLSRCVENFRNNSFYLTEAIVNHKPRSFMHTQDHPIFGFFFLQHIYSLYVKNILLADKLLIFSHNNLFAQDVIFVLIQLNSKQIILSYQSNRQPQTNHKPPDFWNLFLILNPNYVHVCMKVTNGAIT